MRAKPTKPTPRHGGQRAGQWRTKFLATLRATANVRAACEAVGINRSTAYDHYNLYEGFRAEWDEALQEAYDLLEAEAWRRAHDGVDEPVFYQGTLVGTVRKYSDTLLAMLLKAHRPNTFRETVRREHTGPDGGPIQHELHIPPDEELKAIARRILEN